MSRVPELAADTLSPEQRRVRDEIASARNGQARGPFGVWLRVPEIADAANKLGNVLRRKSRFEPRLFELMVLVVVRHWSANYAWNVHAAAAREGSLAPAIIDAIRERRRPEFAREDERVVYDTISELSEKRALSQATYDRALATFGVELLIELIAGAGFYTMVAMTLDAFDIDMAPGGTKLP
jgi:4-carboxymuconolactone decarboxylase